MLSVLAKSIIDTNERFLICSLITSIIYIIIHYILFSQTFSDFIEKFKYTFYGFVIVDLIYASSIFNNKNKNELVIPQKVNEEINDDVMVIEKPYIDNDMMYHPFVSSDNTRDKRLEELNKNINQYQFQKYNQPIQQIQQDKQIEMTKPTEVSEQINKPINETSEQIVNETNEQINVQTEDIKQLKDIVSEKNDTKDTGEIPEVIVEVDAKETAETTNEVNEVNEIEINLDDISSDDE